MTARTKGLTGLAATMLVGVALNPLGSNAASLPAGCVKVQGTVTCSTFDGPGNNQAGVGTTTVDETQGNLTNKSPAPQDLEFSQSCKPPKSQGSPCP